jgi:hypothetical protein
LSNGGACATAYMHGSMQSMRGQVAPRVPDGLSDTPSPFGKIIFILNGPGVPVSLKWRQMVVDEDAEAV